MTHTLSRNTGAIVFAAVAIAAGLVLGSTGWPQPARTLEFTGLIVATILASALAAEHTAGKDRAIMAPSFVIDFAALLLFGPYAAMVVAAAGTIAQWLADPLGSQTRRELLLNTFTAIVAVQAAGSAHLWLGGTFGHFIWPWQGVPIAAALVAYCVIESMLSEILVPLVTRHPLGRQRLRRVLLGWPSYFIGASLAVGIVEVIDHRMWQVLPVAAVPVFLIYRAYCGYVKHLEDEHRRRQVIGSLDHGISVLDSSGRVRRWDEALARIVGCSRQDAMGRTLATAIPHLRTTELPRAIDDVLISQTAQTLSELGLQMPGGSRILQVKIVPIADGVTVLWQDITERARAEQALARREERLALAAEGAHDGLWEWDLRCQEFYVSSRWKAMMGLEGAAGVGRPEQWLERVHADDLGPLKDALKTHLSGQTEYFEHEHRIRHEDGTYRRFLCRGVAVRGSGRRATRIAGSLTDTTERGITLRRAGLVDPLTGLCNRALFVEGLGRRLAELKQGRSGGRFAVLYLDLDRFKVVNDSLGHLVGDELLIAVSRRLESCIRPGDTVSRLGGDEFAILLKGLSDEQQANVIAFRIRESLSAPFSIEGREVFTSASIGIAFGLAQYNNSDEIMRDADTAMYHAKSRGKARHELFDADMHARTRDRLDLETDLRHAVSNNDFEVHYQPIVSLASGMCVGFESLIRWTRNGEAISPETFIPIAEELGLIESVGSWVLQEACRTFAEWQRRFPANRLDCMTVNVSSRQLMQQNFLGIVEQAVQKARLAPCDLRLEITETALMDSPNVVAGVLRDLRDFGVKIYLDDFGTGYSSLSHLHKLPVDALKIDRSFVRSLVHADRPAIVESILALARTLNTSVVAEGIESEMQALELERLGCTHAQGFLFSRPLSKASAEELLAANQPLGPKQGLSLDRIAAGAPEMHYPSRSFEWPGKVRRQVVIHNTSD